MRTKNLILIAAFALATHSAVASETADVMAPIHQFVDGVNKGDAKSAGAAFATEASIIDEIGQHHWAGANAFDGWNAAFSADMKATGVTNPWMKLYSPNLVRVNGDHAYVVQRGFFTYTQNGKKKGEHGVFVYALDKTPSGWRIAAWSWAVQ